MIYPPSKSFIVLYLPVNHKESNIYEGAERHLIVAKRVSNTPPLGGEGTGEATPDRTKPMAGVEPIEKQGEGYGKFPEGE